MTTTQLETPSQAPEQSSKKDKDPFFTRAKIAGFGLVAVALSSLGFWGYGEQKAIDLRAQRDNAAAEADTNGKKASVALWAAQHGISQIVDIDVSTNPPLVELSQDLKNPKACVVWFQFNGDLLLLTQIDAAGKEYDSMEITGGKGAKAVLADICPPAK